MTSAWKEVKRDLLGLRVGGHANYAHLVYKVTEQRNGGQRARDERTVIVQGEPLRLDELAGRPAQRHLLVALVAIEPLYTELVNHLLDSKPAKKRSR